MAGVSLALPVLYANLAEVAKKPIFWKSVPEAGILKINALEQWFSNFYEPWTPVKDSQHVCNISWHLGYAISRQSFLAKASARGPSEPLRGPKGGREPRWRNPALE